MPDVLVIEDELKLGRRKCIEFIYKDILGRGPNQDELYYYMSNGEPLDVVYLNIKASHYSEAKKAKISSNLLPISLVVFCKNNADSIKITLDNMVNVVSEIVIVDTGSTDKTIEICKKYTKRIYNVGFTDFGSIRTLTSHLATQPWVLGLDSDEIINNSEKKLLADLIKDESVDVWGLPRRRWLDLGMTKQVELEVYPDLQYRLFKNNKEVYFGGRVHEEILGFSNKKDTLVGPHIEHFQDVFKTGERLKNRNDMYKKFYDLDIKDGITHNCPAVAKIDEDK